MVFVLDDENINEDKVPQTLDEKIQHSMDVIHLASEASEKYYKKPLVVAISGGKDSDVLLHLVKQSGVPYEILHNHTTVDAPETVYHVREIFRREKEQGIRCTLHMPIYKKRPTNMWKLIAKKKYPPLRTMRYCCTVLKESGGKKRMVALGVRRDESVSRSKREEFEYLSTHQEYQAKKSYRELRESFDNAEVLSEVWECKMITKMRKNQKISCCPILEWSEEDVWEYIKRENIEVNPLYAKGWKRVGCIGCPMAYKNQRLKEFEIYPKYKQLYIKAFDQMLKVREEAGLSNDSWHTGEDVFNWWVK